MSILNVTEKVLVDNSIERFEYHAHQPYTNRYDNNDEIRIPIQEDLCTLPCDSYLHVEGTLLKTDGTLPKTTHFVNNGIAYLFSELRYEINGSLIDSVTRLGVTSTMKGYLSFTPNESMLLQNAGWFTDPKDKIETDTQGRFNACIPLKILTGFCEDYRKVIVNSPQELVLLRSNSDVDALISTTAEGVDDESVKVKIEKIYWMVPHVTPALPQELALTKYIDKNVDTQVPFRSWEVHYHPSVPNVRTFSWSVKTSTALETPRYIIIGFQTDRNGKAKKNASEFDHCDFQNAQVYLNTERFPYDKLNINIPNNRYAALYEKYGKFQSSYYQKQNEPLLSPKNFVKTAPLIAIDCSNQKESLRSRSVALRIEFDTNTEIPPNTTAFCLILHDRLFTYNALTKAVKQV